MGRTRTLGRAESLIYQYVSECAPVSIRTVATHFDQQASLARTTISTMMERLRKKGFLRRKKIEGVYHYSPKLVRENIMRKMVGDFVDQMLGGEISPFLAYLVEDASLDDTEIAELKKVVNELGKTEKRR